MTDRMHCIAAYWDDAAATFDDEPDHGLRADRTRAAWARLLRSVMPPGPVDILDLGCGTGSLSLLLAEAGHRVTGVDVAPRMVERARAKFRGAGVRGRFLTGDASTPPIGDQRFGVLLSRHLVWTLPEPAAALRAWVTRLAPGGRLILIEGRWGKSASPYGSDAGSLPWSGGVSADELASVVSPLADRLHIKALDDDPLLWGGPVRDERYVLVADV
jgi:SAM-dependent methyltransferase